MQTQLEMFLDEAGFTLTLPELMADNLKQANVMEVLSEQVEELIGELYSKEATYVLEHTLPWLMRYYRVKAELQGIKTFIGLPETEPDMLQPPDLHNTLEGLFQDYGMFCGAASAQDMDVAVTPYDYLLETGAFAELPPKDLVATFLLRFYKDVHVADMLRELYPSEEVAKPGDFEPAFAFVDIRNDNWEYEPGMLSLSVTQWNQIGWSMVEHASSLRQAYIHSTNDAEKLDCMQRLGLALEAIDNMQKHLNHKWINTDALRIG